MEVRDVDVLRAERRLEGIRDEGGQQSGVDDKARTGHKALHLFIWKQGRFLGGAVLKARVSVSFTSLALAFNLTLHRIAEVPASPLPLLDFAKLSKLFLSFSANVSSSTQHLRHSRPQWRPQSGEEAPSPADSIAWSTTLSITPTTPWRLREI